MYDHAGRLSDASNTFNNVNYTNTNVSPNQSYTSMGWTYDYYADGRVNHAYDSTWNFFDRSFSYDHVGRLQQANTNKLARGEAWDFWHADPYTQTSNYDVWNNVKFTGYQFNIQQSDSASYTNNRRSDEAYDADGNVTGNLAYGNSIDVASHNVHAISTRNVGDGSSQWPLRPASDMTQAYGADGLPRTRMQITREDHHDLETGQYQGYSEETVTDHYIYSSVLGAQVVDLDQSGQANVWVFAGGQRIATAIGGTNGNTTFEHHNPVTTSRITTNGHSANRAAMRQERDPQTAPVALSGGSYSAASNFNQPLGFEGGDPSDLVPGVTVDGMPMTRSDYNRLFGESSTAGFMSKMMLFDVSVPFRPIDNARVVTVPIAGTFGVLLPDPPSGHASGHTGVPQNSGQNTTQPQRARTTPTPNPCGVAIPSDANDRAMLATLLGEASSPGERTWDSNQSGVAAYQHPTGTLSEENVYDEMLQMVAVVNHRLTDWAASQGYQNWQDVVSAPGQFLGYGNGQNILQNLGSQGSVNCTRAGLGVAAIAAFHASPWTSRFFYWKGIKQQNSRGQMFIRTLSGAWRWANTDFQIRQ